MSKPLKSTTVHIAERGHTAVWKESSYFMAHKSMCVPFKNMKKATAIGRTKK